MAAGRRSPEYRRILAEAAKAKGERARQVRLAAAERIRKPRRPALNGHAILLLFFVVAAMLTALPTAIVLVVGMMPTFGAFLVDRTPKRFATTTVGGLNFAGVAPFLINLWNGPGGIANAVGTIVDPFAIFVMYGAAAAGWSLFASAPALSQGWRSFGAHRRIEKLKARQQALVAEWGTSIMPTPPAGGEIAASPPAPRP